ncbi:MAG: Glu/Leu/Phe/Val dehydrogenase [Chloroflexi bacterium]|nr:Glu/Leu/Phe/Val dehydrogenase [Chloroflexota bacterium]
MDILPQLLASDYEQLVLCTDRSAGLKALICIHSTALGPALGGTRMWPYATEEAALTDALRLAKAMTYKAAAASLDLGGGKAVIIGDPHTDKSEALFRSFGRYVESLNGRYITAEDLGTTPADLEYVAMETRWLTGKPLHLGGSGDSAPATGLGVFVAMQACAKEVWGAESLAGKRVLVQGFGKVASNLAKHLKEADAALLVAEVDPAARARAESEFGAALVDPQNALSTECDVLAPCALGGVLNSHTIPALRCAIVCGGANNQLLEPADGERLDQRSILYAPDYVVNAGGLINLSFELTGYNEQAATARVLRIRDTLEKLIALSKARCIPTAVAADRMAEERLALVRKRDPFFLRRDEHRPSY